MFGGWMAVVIPKYQNDFYWLSVFALWLPIFHPCAKIGAYCCFVYTILNRIDLLIDGYRILITDIAPQNWVQYCDNTDIAPQRKKCDCTGVSQTYLQIKYWISIFTDTLLQRALPLQVLSRRGRGPHSYEVSSIFGKFYYTFLKHLTL